MLSKIGVCCSGITIRGSGGLIHVVIVREGRYKERAFVWILRGGLDFEFTPYSKQPMYRATILFEQERYVWLSELVVPRPEATASSYYVIRVADNFTLYNISNLDRIFKGDLERGCQRISSPLICLHFVAHLGNEPVMSSSIALHASLGEAVVICSQKATYKEHSIRHTTFYRLLFATRSNSSFFLIAYEFELPLAALISSSAKHSATLFTFLKAASRAPIVRRAIAWLTRRRGETSTA